MTPPAFKTKVFKFFVDNKHMPDLVDPQDGPSHMAGSVQSDPW